MRRAVVMAAWMGLACIPCGAQPAAQRGDALKVGDPAPPLAAVQWLKGEPVPHFEQGRLYVVVFSATWCPTSRKAIPYLTELANRYAERLTLIDFFTWADGTKEAPQDLGYVDAAKYLMKSMGKKMDFNIAVDVPQQTTADAWRLEGVPTAFVVDRDGTLAWIGAPTALDPVLRQMTTGSFNAVTATRQQQEFNASLYRVQQLARSGQYRQALPMLDALIATHPQDSALYGTKYRVLAGNDDEQANSLLKWLLKADIPGFDWDHLVSSTYGLSKDQDYDLALAAVDRAIARSETKQVAARLLEQEINIHLLRSMKRPRAAEANSDISKAATALERAFDLSREPGAPTNSRLARSLRQSQFKVWAAAGDARANGLLRTLLHEGNPRTNWSNYVDAGLKHQRSPDYALLLDVADRAIAQADQEGWDKAYSLSRKAEVYLAQGDTSHALASYKQAVEAAKLGDDAAGVRRYEKRLDELRQKYLAR